MGLAAPYTTILSGPSSSQVPGGSNESRPRRKFSKTNNVQRVSAITVHGAQPQLFYRQRTLLDLERLFRDIQLFQGAISFFIAGGKRTKRMATVDTKVHLSAVPCILPTTYLTQQINRDCHFEAMSFIRRYNSSSCSHQAAALKAIHSSTNTNMPMG
jgi:hypothetical protein